MGQPMVERREQTSNEIIIEVEEARKNYYKQEEDTAAHHDEEVGSRPGEQNRKLMKAYAMEGDEVLVSENDET